MSEKEDSGDFRYFIPGEIPRTKNEQFNREKINGMKDLATKILLQTREMLDLLGYYREEFEEREKSDEIPDEKLLIEYQFAVTEFKQFCVDYRIQCKEVFELEAKIGAGIYDPILDRIDRLKREKPPVN